MSSAIVSSATLPVLQKLERLVEEVVDIHSKLILLVGIHGKTKTLRELGVRLNASPFNLGLELGHSLATIPVTKRSFSVGELLREITDKSRNKEPLLLDNLEVLFEPSLKINPLDSIKRLAHSRPVVAVWPGEVRDDHLLYAKMGHPEYRDYGRDGVVVFDVVQSHEGI